MTSARAYFISLGLTSPGPAWKALCTEQRYLPLWLQCQAARQVHAPIHCHQVNLKWKMEHTVTDLFWSVIFRGPVWDYTHAWTSVPILLTKAPEPAVKHTYIIPFLVSIKLLFSLTWAVCGHTCADHEASHTEPRQPR